MQIDNFTAENGYVVVENVPHQLISKTDSGIIIAEVNRWESLMAGTIKVLASDVNLPEDVKVGTKVYYVEKEVKSRFKLEGKEYLTLKDINLMAYE